MEPDARAMLVIAIHPIHADAILSGRKRAELRARFPAIQPGTKVYLYCTAPTSAVVGGFIAGLVHEGTPSRLWRSFRGELGVDREAFNSYVGLRSKAKVLLVREAFTLRRRATRQELELLGHGFSPPQSVAFIKSEQVRSHLERLTPRATVMNS